ncbi:MAG TPA: arginine--tRNA ligase, partial [Bacteroidales bacterium]|nr:arginine--tRNA ligase [Bacteroidales bacterium]
TAFTKMPPDKTAEVIGRYLIDKSVWFEKYNVIKGFLNLSLKQEQWTSFFAESSADPAFGFQEARPGSEPTVLEYSSPNTNKPLHLGHVRNNLLGSSLAKILKANGQAVVQVNLVNDRGIHICKSMLAWHKWGNGETPESTGMKGDHFVGKYYVLFDQNLKAEIEEQVAKGAERDIAARNAPLLLEAQEVLRKWEDHEPDTLALWNRMNHWVYEGFATTYQRMGISFDQTFYESQTYLLGKEMVDEGLEKGVFYRKEDGAVWADLAAEGLDEKLLLRSDGTSVYITQDLGTANQRYEVFKPERMIYVVGNEQNYHFDVLRFLLKKLDKEWWNRVQHFSYGMVELPEGKMKSREGTVVDADELLQEMFDVAKATTEELGKADSDPNVEMSDLYWTLALGALKFFILKVDPKKNMMFNPQESIDFNGNTGPFIQYTHARIKSLLGKASDRKLNSEAPFNPDYVLAHGERNLLRFLYEFPDTVAQAGSSLSPAVIANYVYDLAKEYNHFYQEVPVLREEDASIRYFRLSVSSMVADIIRKSMSLL